MSQYQIFMFILGKIKNKSTQQTILLVKFYFYFVLMNYKYKFSEAEREKESL